MGLNKGVGLFLPLLSIRIISMHQLLGGSHLLQLSFAAHSDIFTSGFHNPTHLLIPYLPQDIFERCDYGGDR